MVRKGQDEICKAIEELDGEGKFRSDAWVRESGGGGISRVLSGGKVFEKAGVNLSVVYGTMPQEALQAATSRGVDRAKGMAPGERVPFFACGLSSVMHPRNPFAPTMHFNYRYFETDGGVWWFGGNVFAPLSFEIAFKRHLILYLFRRDGHYSLLSGRGGHETLPRDL